MFCVCYIDHYKSNSINQSPTTTTTTTSDVLIKKKKKKFCHCLDICFLDQISIQNSLNFNKIWIKFVIKKKKNIVIHHHHHSDDESANSMNQKKKTLSSSSSAKQQRIIYDLKTSKFIKFTWWKKFNFLVENFQYNLFW